MNIPLTLLKTVLGTRLPTRTGDLEIQGCHRPIVIRRDTFDIPYIEAGDDEDAWFGLGFCHGQDRAFQLEFVVRAIRGTLAEIAGIDALPIDRLSRRVGFRRAAEGQLPAMREDIRRQAEAYVAGVNEGRRRGAEKLAHEFALLGCDPTPLEAADVQGVFVLLCFALAANWDMELLRLNILEKDGPEALAALEPSYPSHLPVAVPAGALAGKALDLLAEDIRTFHALMGTGGASNAWVVAGSRTKSGRPILANDPHLNPALPCVWYLARLTTPAWSAAGATFVGLPGFAAAHNGHAAWGVTAGHADNTDLFLEEIGPDGRSVREGDCYVPCPVRREIIHVKGRRPVVEEVLITPRGPIVGPAFDGQRHALSMAATWLRPERTDGLAIMHRVRDVGGFREAFRHATACAIGVVYADVDGHIAWQLATAVPKRRKGSGHLPMPGWDPGCGWEPDLVPPERLPFAVDPEAGFLCTANSQPVPHDHDGPFLGIDWLDGYRQGAITASLSQRHDWDVAGMLELQCDVRSLPWLEIRETVLAVPVTSREARLAQEMLAAWDGRLTSSSREASIYVFFIAGLCQRVVRAHAPRSAAYALGRGFSKLLPNTMIITRRLSHLSRLLREQPAGYLSAGWERGIEASLHDAVLELRRRRGRPDRWAWGEVRPITLVHPFGEKAPLNRIFNLGPLPGWGDASTIAQGSVDLLDPARNAVGLPTLRAVIDVANWDASRFILFGGQSGNPLSRHYRDQATLFLRGAALPIAWSEEAVRRATVSTLTLIPKGSRAQNEGEREAV